MPLDEDFTVAAPAAAAAAVVDIPAAAADAAAADTTTTAAADTATASSAAAGAGVDAAKPADTTAVADTTAAAAPSFDEKAWLKTTLGDDAPETAAELKERLQSMRANQLNDVQKGQLALLSDPAKLADYARMAGRDFDKPDAVAIMREKFAIDNPDMSPGKAQRDFDKQFKEKYPLLSEFLANPSEFDANDPAIAAEREDAEYDAKKDRAALKTHFQTATEDFLKSAAAPTASATPEQIADATAVMKWFDETVKDGYALPIDIGNGEKINMPVGDPASFKEAFVNTDSRYLALVKNADGTINRDMQSKVALFLSNPAAYDAYIANASKGAKAPALAVAELTNSSAAQQAAAASAAAPAATAAPAKRTGNSAAWQKMNV